MTPVLMTKDAPIALIGAGDSTPSIMKFAVDRSSALVAADGGAQAAIGAGYIPDLVIGDFDSIDEATLAQVPRDRVHHVAEQDSTDFEKCLMRLRAPLVLSVGFTGARLDHTLAVMSVMVRYAERQPCAVLGSEDLCFVLPPRFEVTLPAATTVSLFPMAPVRGRSVGLRWPIDGIDFAPAGRVGTSNEAIGGP
ncbi:MAG: thiamine diphosphokinase, partial [Pseudomonadota bacterium]